MVLDHRTWHVTTLIEVFAQVFGTSPRRPDPRHAARHFVMMRDGAMSGAHLDGVDASVPRFATVEKSRLCRSTSAIPKEQVYRRSKWVTGPCVRSCQRGKENTRRASRPRRRANASSPGSVPDHAGDQLLFPITRGTTLTRERPSVMPLARIDLIEGKSVEYRQTIGDVVYDKMIECLGVPEDRFQVITEHKAENFSYDRDYLGIYRSENCVFIQLVFLDVASPEQKATFYKAVVDDLHEKLQMRREDVFFNLMTVTPSDWSMGNGIATYFNGVPTDRLDPTSVQ
ncbi:tautomerase family protein [Actinoallomurus bryophytorum]|nr:tautomerase family protein [Actinoallomurus bryophytorum]